MKININNRNKIENTNIGNNNCIEGKIEKNESKIIQYIIELAIAIISGIVVALIVYKFNLQ